MAQAEILFMRHPQTVANTAHILSGRRNVELTELGKTQAKQAAQALVHYKPDVIYSSPLSRCLAIAAPAAQNLGCELIEDRRIIEFDFGVIEGMNTEQIKKSGYSFPWKIDEQGRSCPAPDAESYEEIIARAKAVLKDLCSQHKRIACVTHSGFTHAVFCAALDIDIHNFWDIAVQNVSSQIFIERDDRFKDEPRLVLHALNLSPEELEHKVAERR